MEFRTFEGSHSQEVMNEWFENPNFVGRSLRNCALNYEFQNENGSQVVERQDIITDENSVVPDPYLPNVY